MVRNDSIIGTILHYIVMIIVLFISVCLFVFSFGVVSFDFLMQYIGMYYNGNFIINIITALIAALLTIASIRLMFPRKRQKKLTGALVKNTELGEIQVSLGTLNNLAQKAVRKFDEVKDIESNIRTEVDGVDIQLKLMVMPDVIIPDITQKIQDEVKSYIESLAGIHVREVQIFIDNLTHTQTPRVE